MDFVIEPYKGALPLVFGMNREEVSSLFPLIEKSNIETFGPSQVNLGNDIFLNFENGKLSEIEFFTAKNNYDTGEISELTPDLNLTLYINGQQMNILQSDNTLDLLNQIDRPMYAEGVWIYPAIGATFYGYDRSQDYRSLCLFDKTLLSFYMDGAEEGPISTDLREID
ncbi:hypothetical protein ACAW74_23495 [Fibrella sp. WM1]|uniref:hypothetical protein n=1 Tax=Fibrella musci TaxID=3242485 RepID=UPI0035207E97